MAVLGNAGRGKVEGSERYMWPEFQKFRTTDQQVRIWVQNPSPTTDSSLHKVIISHNSLPHFFIRQARWICQTKQHLKEFGPSDWNNVIIKFCDFLRGWKQNLSCEWKTKSETHYFHRTLMLCNANPLSELMSLCQRVRLLIISFTSPLRITMVLNTF